MSFALFTDTSSNLPTPVLENGPGTVALFFEGDPDVRNKF